MSLDGSERQLTQLLCDSVGAAACPMGESLPAGRWSRAGELDSPVPPGRIDEVAGRSPKTLTALLEREVSDGGGIVVTGHRLVGVGFLLDRLAALHAQGGRLPLALDLEGAAWAGTLEETVDRELGRAGGRYALRWRASDCALVLLRPDRAFAGRRPVDSVVLRNELWRWLHERPSDWLMPLLDPICFASRDPPPGVLVLRQPDTAVTAAPNPQRRDHDAPTGRVVEALEGDDERSLVARSYDLIGKPSYEPRRPPDALAVALSTRSAWERLHRAFRTIVAEVTGTATGPPALPPALPWTHAQVSAGIYCALRSGGPDSPSTFAGLDLGRWLCLLRAGRYELLAAAAASLRGERLARCHLVHGPPLDFACLRGADLERSDLYRVNFADADLRQANLRGADLARAHLKRADLRDSDLRGADLTYASLEQANLTDARLEGADLDRAFLDDAIGLP